MPSTKWPLKLGSRRSNVGSDEDKLEIEAMYETCDGLKKMKKDITLWTSKILKACPSVDVKTLTSSLSNYTDKLSGDDGDKLIEKAAHRTGGIIQFLDDQQKALAAQVMEQFEKPAKEFLENDVTESIQALSAFEKASEALRTTNKRLKAALKKLNNAQKQGEAQQEQIAARSHWERQKEFTMRLVTKTAAKHEFFTLDILNKLVSSYREFFSNMTAHFSVIEQELEISKQASDSKREKFKKDFPPDYVPSIPDKEQALNVSRGVNFPERTLMSPTSEPSKKKRKRSSSVDKRYNILVELMESGREYYENLHSLCKIKTKLLREPKVSSYSTSIYNIFANIDELAKYQKNMLNELIPIVNNWSSSTRCIGEFFNKQSPQQDELYENFARNYISAALSLRKARKLTNFDTCLKEIEKSVGAQITTLLPSILSHPVRMLKAVQTLFNETAKHHPDHTPLSNSMALYRAMCNNINQYGFSSENISKLQELQNKIHGAEDVLTIAEPHRTFLKEGFVSVDFDHVKSRRSKRDEFYTFLLSDIIIFTKRQAPNSILKKRGVNHSYQYVDHGFLYRAGLEFDDIRRGIRLICPSKVFCMYWDKPEYQDSWRTTLSSIISDLQKPKLFGISFKELMRGCQNQKTIVPNIVIDCVQYILSKGLYTRGIFSELPFEEEAEGLREALDHEEAVSFEESSPLTVSWLLLRWLRELPEPLIPSLYYNDVVSVTTPEEARVVLEKLPVFNRFTLEYIMGCCECVVSHAKTTGMNATQLAVLFAPCLIRQGKNIYNVDDFAKCVQFVIFLIAEFNLTFESITVDRIATETDEARKTELFKQFQTELQVSGQRTPHKPITSASLADKLPSIDLSLASLSQDSIRKTSQSTGNITRKSRDKLKPKSPRGFVQCKLSESVPSLVVDPPPTGAQYSSAPLTLNSCSGCAQPIMGRPLHIIGKTWHENCFVCVKCKGKFANGKFYENGGSAFCENCLQDEMICNQCQQKIVGSFTKALGRYWHPEHFTCANCSRQLANGFYESNGSFLCGECVKK